MTTQPQKLGKIHFSLMTLVVISIVGELGNVIAWWAVPSSQISLNGGTIEGVTSPPSILSGVVGAQNALVIGSVILIAVAAVYAYSLLGMRNKKPSAPLTIIGVSIVNRILGVFIFTMNPTFAIWAVWTVILVVFAYLDWRQLKN